MTRRAKSESPAPEIGARRLVNRRLGAHYLCVSPAAFDAWRARGYITATPVPSPHGDGASRVPLFDLRDLDDTVDRWKAEGVDAFIRPSPPPKPQHRRKQSAQQKG